MKKFPQHKIKEMGEGVWEFAYWPTILECGKVIWLKRYWAKYSIGTNSDGELFFWSNSRERLIPIVSWYLSPEDATMQKLKGD